MSDALLTVEELATRIRLKPKTVYAMVAKRSVPFVKIGGAVRFKPAAIDQWLAQNSVRVNCGVGA